MTHIDSTFAREIKRVANGDGTREDRFSFFKTAKAACKELSSPDVLYIFNDIIKKYGRVAVGLCVAATAIYREDRLEYETVRWAREVASIWTNRPPAWIDHIIIMDGLHPSRLEQYAGDFIRATTI